MFNLKKIIGISMLILAVLLTSCSEKKETSGNYVSMGSISSSTDNKNETPETNKTDTSDTSEKTEVDTTPSEEEISSEQTEQGTADEEEIETLPFVNPLTGLGCETDLTNARPIAVMVNNLQQALPQIGISDADVIYETLEEGGITRLLCIFNNYEDIPEIGSIRSTRDYYIDIADAHDAILVHSGGSTYAYTALKNRGTNNIDGIYMSNFYRNTERLKTMSTEHTLMISGKGIAENIAIRGYRTTTDNPSPLVFSKEYKTGSQPANNISIPHVMSAGTTPYITSTFDYGSTSKMYHKGHFGVQHIDGDDGQQLTFKNVITLSCPMNRIAGDALGCIQVHFTGTGKGTYSVEGTTREIVWKKPSRGEAYTLYESDGETPLVVAPGKSYIAVVSTAAPVTIK